MTHKKKLAIFIPLGALLLLVVACVIIMQGKTFSVAHIIKAENGNYLWVDKVGSPYVINEKGVCKLDNFDTGDKVLLLRDNMVLTTYPGQNTVYFAFKLEDGKEKDIDKSVINSLTEMGWGITKITDEKSNIQSIVDHSADDGVSYATALELFYSDNEYDYYFPNIISQYIIVKYKDGTGENVKDALANNNIKIADLDDFNINYTKEEKEVITKQNPYFNAEVLEVREKTILVKPDADAKEAKSSDKISVSLDFISTIPVPNFNVGDRVRVIYNGNIAESYPAQINGVFVVYLLSDDGNILSPTPQQPEQNVYCGNTQTTIKKDGKEYTFMGGDSVTLTDLLRTLNYDNGICKCLPDYTVDTEFGIGYGIKLIEGEAYVRYNGKQCSLTDEQVAIIKKIIENQCN